MASERLQRLIEFQRRHSNAVTTAALFVILAVVVVLVAFFDRTPSLSHARAAFFSGDPRGNYHAIVERLAQEARRRHGQIENIPSAGSVDNVQRLIAGKAANRAQFALVQDGTDWPPGAALELIGRLGSPESFVLLGRNAD